MYDVRAATINIPRCSSDRQEPSWHQHWHKMDPALSDGGKDMVRGPDLADTGSNQQQPNIEQS